MTADQQRQFENTWPALALRLQRFLSRKNISPWLIEDLVQETGLRLIKMWPRVDQTRPVWPLTTTIALNLLRDELRRGSSSEVIEMVPDGVSEENVEDRGLARVELRAVGGALSRMTEPQREAILAGIDGDPNTSRTPTGVRMMRMRARRKLQYLLDHASVLGVTIGVQMRRLAREVELFIGRAIPTDADRATAALVGLLAALSFGVAVVPSSPSQAGQPDVVSRPIGSAGGAADLSQPQAADRSREISLEAAESRGQKDSDRRSGGKAARDGSGADEAGQAFERGTRYRLWLDEGTFAQGEIEADIEGLPSGSRDSFAPPSGVGTATCTVAPGEVGASCQHSGEGGEQRSVRARHRGEAWVAGQRVI